MNIKGNQRYQDTKIQIKGAFLNLLKAKKQIISVRMICDEAQIHRTTFYGHYEDINGLMQELVEEMYEQIMTFFCQMGIPLTRRALINYSIWPEKRKSFLFIILRILDRICGEISWCRICF